MPDLISKIKEEIITESKIKEKVFEKKESEPLKTQPIIK